MQPPPSHCHKCQSLLVVPRSCVTHLLVSLAHGWGSSCDTVTSGCTSETSDEEGTQHAKRTKMERGSATKSHGRSLKRGHGHTSERGCDQTPERGCGQTPERRRGHTPERGRGHTSERGLAHTLGRGQGVSQSMKHTPLLILFLEVTAWHYSHKSFLNSYIIECYLCMLEK